MRGKSTRLCYQIRTRHPQYAVSAFKNCGIVPLNLSKFSELEFKPSTVTDQEAPEASISDSEELQTNTRSRAHETSMADVAQMLSDDDGASDNAPYSGI